MESFFKRLKRRILRVERREVRLDAVFRQEEISALWLVAWIRTGAMVVVAAWLILERLSPRLTENLISAVLFGALGWVYYAFSVRRTVSTWYYLAVPLLDALIILDNVLPIMPWNAPPVPAPIVLRFDAEAFLIIPLMLAAFLYSPWRTFWRSVVTALVWIAAALWVLSRPGAFTVMHLGNMAATDPKQYLATFLDPNFVDLDKVANFAFVVVLTGALLSLAVWRTRKLVLRAMSVERARSHLARYFSPNMVDALQAADETLGQVRHQDVGVLFADIIGFTRLAEKLDPERVVALLRSFHRRMAHTVFTHHGTLDKYIGDAVMATFGTPHVGPQDAVNALLCARAMVEELGRWNRKRVARGAAPIRVSIGVHYGSAVQGDIGDERRLEYAVIGDTVNVASRIERLTRTVGADILVTQDLVDAARRQAPELAAQALAGFVPDKKRQLRGRTEPVLLWAYRDPTALLISDQTAA
jgi:adenylate cyclase